MGAREWAERTVQRKGSVSFELPTIVGNEVKELLRCILVKWAIVALSSGLYSRWEPVSGRTHTWVGNLFFFVNETFDDTMVGGLDI